MNLHPEQHCVFFGYVKKGGLHKDNCRQCRLIAHAMVDSYNRALDDVHTRIIKKGITFTNADIEALRKVCFHIRREAKP
jgi:hypothetical protein